MATAGLQGRKRILRDEDMTKVEFETSEEVDVTPTFDTMGLREDLLRGIYAYGRPGIHTASRGELAQDAKANIRLSVYILFITYDSIYKKKYFLLLYIFVVDRGSTYVVVDLFVSVLVGLLSNLA